MTIGWIYAPHGESIPPQLARDAACPESAVTRLREPGGTSDSGHATGLVCVTSLREVGRTSDSGHATVRLPVTSLREPSGTSDSGHASGHDADSGTEGLAERLFQNVRKGPIA